MTKLSLLGAAAVLSTGLASMLASPVMAQQVISNPGYCAQFYPNANCDNYGAGNPYTNGGYFNPRSAYNSYNRWDGPMDASDGYLRANGFACRPGSRFRGEDGHLHVCQ
jgi:ABC-type multidrug transport system permease subunit